MQNDAYCKNMSRIQTNRFCLYFEFICFKCLFKYFLNIIYSFLRGLAVSCNLVQFTDVLSLIGHLWDHVLIVCSIQDWSWLHIGIYNIQLKLTPSSDCPYHLILHPWETANHPSIPRVPVNNSRSWLMSTHCVTCLFGFTCFYLKSLGIVFFFVDELFDWITGVRSSLGTEV